MNTSRPPSIRHCPLCGIAMQANNSRDNIVEFRCQTCQTTIVEKPRSPRAH